MQNAANVECNFTLNVIISFVFALFVVPALKESPPILAFLTVIAL
jgi:hypothetical protein